MNRWTNFAATGLFYCAEVQNLTFFQQKAEPVDPVPLFVLLKIKASVRTLIYRFGIGNHPIILLICRI